MKKTNAKEVKKIMDEAKKNIGKDLHYMLMVYKSDDGKQLKFTHGVETDLLEAIIGILERSKTLLVDFANKASKKPKLLPKKKKKKAKPKKK